MQEFEVTALLKSIRGNRTPKEMSEILGYSYNKYIKLEGAYQHLSWEQFVHLCHCENKDLKDILFRYFHIKLVSLEQSEVVSELIKTWRFESEEKLLLATGFTKSKLWRLKSGKSKLLLSELVLILDHLVGKRGRDLFKELIASNLENKDSSALSNDELLEIIRHYPEFASFIGIGRTSTYQKSKSLQERKRIFANSVCISLERLDIIREGILRFGIDIFDDDTFKPFKICISSMDMKTHNILNGHALNIHNFHQNDLNANRSKLKSTTLISAVSKSDITKILDVLDRSMKDIANIMLTETDEEKSELATFYMGNVETSFEQDVPKLKH